MTQTLKHQNWFKKSKKTFQTVEGAELNIWKFDYQKDDAVMSAWATHFRNHYCNDGEIDALRSGTGLSRSQYLNALCFPDEAKFPGPIIRAGDFAETLVADFIEFLLNYWVPRLRYQTKAIRNKSTEGSDVIGIKELKQGKESIKDELLIYEVKAQLTGTEAEAKLQEAVDHSVKDDIRKAESLNFIKRQLLKSGGLTEASRVERFQNIEDRPYTDLRGAVAVFSTQLIDTRKLKQTVLKDHPHKSKVSLLVFYGDDLMTLVHELYRRAANEA